MSIIAFDFLAGHWKTLWPRIGLRPVKSGGDAPKAKLKSDPHAALAEHGVEVPVGATVKVVENTKDTLHLVLPTAPEDELSEEDLEKVAAAGGTYWSYL